MVSYEEIGSLWAIACEKADLEPDTGAVLYVIKGEAADGDPTALYVDPDSEVYSEAIWPLDPKQVADANSPERRNIHRILVRDFRSSRVALGRLRHELEHARQYDRCLDTYLAMGFAQDAVARALDERKPACRKGSGAIYNLLPFEEDANRAAAQLTTTYFGAPTSAELLGDDSQLFRDESPIQSDTLTRRLLAISALFPRSFSWMAQKRNKEVRDLLAHLGPDAWTAWGVLQDHPEISQCGEAALALCPSANAIKIASKPASAWSSVTDTIQEGRQIAEATLNAAFPRLNLH